MTILAALVLAPVAVPTAALGQGNAGVDEYVEELPGAGGGKPDKGGGDDGGGGPLTPAQVTSLEELGSDGAAAAALAQGSGPRMTGRVTPATVTRRPPSVTSARASPTSWAPSTGDSESGSGVALPIVLVAALVAAVAFLLFRRSRRRPGPA